jgi:glutathione synthase/RimK-type ligase-like ATP-grasp enzyme
MGVAIRPDSCCILNGGDGAWVFGALADQLSRSLWVDVTDVPRKINYFLHSDDISPTCCELFIPYHAMQIASDKRLLAEVFKGAGVPIPETRLLASMDEAERMLVDHPNQEWCLKFPTGCGATGHRRLISGMALPKNWPLPLLVQEFIRLDRPEVFRMYAAGGELFGWVVRRFPEGVSTTPWVAHARGARYGDPGSATVTAIDAAKAALSAVGLLETFGCVDLMRRATGEWVVLEVGTDGVFNHVDRELGMPTLELEIARRVAETFWSRLGDWRPWGSGAWHFRTV